MPKEMVFVLDTSGSMSGEPIETAKKTMQLALNTLYPHDTFNLITFSVTLKFCSQNLSRQHPKTFARRAAPL